MCGQVSRLGDLPLLKVTTHLLSLTHYVCAFKTCDSQTVVLFPYVQTFFFYGNLVIDAMYHLPRQKDLT